MYDVVTSNKPRKAVGFLRGGLSQFRRGHLVRAAIFFVIPP